MQRNRARDEHSTVAAETAGWTVVRLWECTVRADPVRSARAVLAGESLPPVEQRP
jgi:DNA mismatch endonuclease (patch repair protein)